MPREKTRWKLILPRWARRAGEVNEKARAPAAAADSALAAAPDDVERLIEAGRVRRNFWHYRQAMELCTLAAELAPEDWRPYRFRGHRHISLRDFDAAIVDLERARELAPLNWDVSYHLGLAYFLAGRSDDVEENVAYYHTLLFYKGEMSADELLNPGPDAPYRWETVGFAVANWMLARGDTAEARVVLQQLVQDPWWPGFGRIAAEAELAHLDGSG